jgi:enamine deaminase RidA (YjgF/YER057c/UK114 family)
MSVQEKLAEMGLTLPSPPKPLAVYVPAVRAGHLIFVSGQLPLVDGHLQQQGKVGRQVGLEQAQELARLAALNCLSAVSELVPLDQLAQIVKLTGYVACDPDFYDQPKVMNGASMMLSYVFGEAGRHARAAIGVNVLPLNSPVEVEMIVLVK